MITASQGSHEYNANWWLYVSPTAHGQAAKASTGGELRRGLRRVGVLVEKKVPGM